MRNHLDDAALPARARNLPMFNGALLAAQSGGSVTADDVLWRRTKCGLPMDIEQRAAVAAYVGQRR